VTRTTRAGQLIADNPASSEIAYTA